MSSMRDNLELLENEIQAIVPALRLAQASQLVHELAIIHLFSHFAELVEDRHSYLADILAGIEASIKLQVEATRKQYGPDAVPSINDTLSYFAHFRAMMLGTVPLPVQGTKN